MVWDMRNEEKMIELRAMHRVMLDRIAALSSKGLPKGVDIDKLEKAYDSLKVLIIQLLYRI